jgi:hypothetical protein
LLLIEASKCPDGDKAFAEEVVFGLGTVNPVDGVGVA